MTDARFGLWNKQITDRSAVSDLCTYFYISTNLDQFSLFERLVGTVFSNRPQAFGRNFDSYVLVELWYVQPFLLQVWLSAGFTTRIKLRRTRAVAVAAPNLGFFAGYVTLFCHRR